jgi:hypothetical protein
MVARMNCNFGTTDCTDFTETEHAVSVLSVKSVVALVLAVVAGGLLAACSFTGTEEIDISPPHEYKFERRQGKRPPVILIPGTLGSKLYNRENGEIAWGSFAATISDLRDDLDLPIDGRTLARNQDDLRPYRVLDYAEILMREGSGEVSFYADLIEFLSTTLGYRPAYGERFHPGHDLFVFFYDWRRSNVEAAVQLQEFIENIRRDLREPDQKFTFLCVSNGGLIARYYMRYGGEDVVSGQSPDAPFEPTWAGLRDCDNLVCLGTPHNGTIDALHLIHDGYSPNLLARRYPPETIFSFPAAFELLPDPGERVFVGEGGETLDVDLWDPRVWETYGLSVFSESSQDRLRASIINEIQPGESRDAQFETVMQDRRDYLRLVLAHALRLRRSIEGPPGVPTHVILGVNTPTLERVGLVQDDEEWELIFRPQFSTQRFDPMADAMFGTGDGVVTRRSGLGLYLPESAPELVKRGVEFRASLESWTFTPFTHREMFADEMLRLTLAETLSRP